MDAALQALLAIEPERGRRVTLADEKILFRVGQEFHRRWDRRNPKDPLIGALCREAIRQADEFFDSKGPDSQKTELDRLKLKFKSKLDYYCSVGSALVDYDARRREIITSQIVGLLGELGLVKGEK